MTVIGRRELRLEDKELLTGSAKYISDLTVDGSAFVAYVRSSVAHAELESVDLSSVRQMPGVVGAFSASDLDLTDIPSPALAGGRVNAELLGRPLLAHDKVRYVGEPIAAVVVEHPSLAEDAIALVDVRYNPLAAVVDPEKACQDGTLLYPQAGTNVVASFEFGDSDLIFDGFDIVLSQRLINHRVLSAPMEVRGCIAKWEEDGRVSIWLSTQAPHLAQPAFARVLGVDKDRVRLRPVAVGGGFGAKAFAYPEELLVPVLSRILGRPLKWVETRSESMVSLTTGRGQITTITIGADKNGIVGAVDFDVLQDNGAYTGIGTGMPAVGWLLATGPYAIPRARLKGRSVLTNTTPTGAYRGAGRPEPAYALERMMDLLASELGLDPAEVRRRNLIPKSSYPYLAATGTKYDSGNLTGALDTVLELSKYDQLRLEQARIREAGGRSRLGIGMSVFVDVAGRLSPPESGSVEVLEDGSIVVKTGSSPHGQGHATVWAMIVAEQTGIEMAKVKFIYGDTDEVPIGGDTFGSKSLQSAGVTVHRAAVKLVERSRELAANMLEASVDDIVLDTDKGQFYVQGTPEIALTWQDLAKSEIEAGRRLEETVTFEGSQPTYPNGAYIAVVEVDIETGHVKVRQLITCDDAGRIINPLIAEGQVHGGVSQGIAQALYEELRYDTEGNPLTSTFADYLIVSACEVPSFDGTFQETLSDRNELGVKGIGESGSIGSTPAVVNAVIDALSEFGIRHIDMPLSPERVWSSLN
jgi:carbon-monoxide dehydrogenase large subunit